MACSGVTPEHWRSERDRVVKVLRSEQAERVETAVAGTDVGQLPAS